MTIRMVAKPTLLSLGLMSIIGCTTNHSLNQTANQPMTQTAASQATVYYNGDIITMASDEPEMVEALVTKAGKIAYVGSLTEAQNKYKSAAQVDLKNQTLLPSFIDPHSHFGLVSNTMGQANLNPPPIGDVDSIDKMLQTLKAYKKDNSIADGEWIFAWGYDETQLSEERHPTKDEIDSVLPNNPVYLQHTSGHMASPTLKA